MTNEISNIWSLPQGSIIPLIVAAITILLGYGIFNYKAAFAKIHEWIMYLLGKTLTPEDERLYLTIIDEFGKYFHSEEFKEHWKVFENAVADGKLDKEEVELLRKKCILEIVNDIKRFSIEIYSSDEGKRIVAGLIEYYSKMANDKIGSKLGFLKKFGFGLAIVVAKRWVKDAINKIFGTK